MTANNPTPYQRHTEADQHHEDLTRLPDRDHPASQPPRQHLVGRPTP